MHDHIARAVYYVDIHFLYASLVGCSVWALTSIRGTTATIKYWMWILTVANFIVPVAAMVDRAWAQHFSWASPLGMIASAAWTITEGRAALTVAVIWLAGAASMAVRLIVRLRIEGRQITEGPAVSGLLRPLIVLPRDIFRVLTADELQAVVVHELTHAKRRDNLIRLAYECVLCLLWFNPVVWLAGRRMAVYRELSCDESVIQRGNARPFISALAKLAAPENAPFLHATASAHLCDRLKLLEAPRQSSIVVTSMVIVLFASAIAAGVAGTVAHTACCFILGR